MLERGVAQRGTKWSDLQRILLTAEAEVSLRRFPSRSSLLSSPSTANAVVGCHCNSFRGSAPRRTSRLIKGSCELQRRSGKVENFGYSDSRDSDNHLQWQLFWSHKEDLLMLKVIGQRDNRQHWHVCQFPPVSLLPKLSCRVIYGTLCSPNPKKIRQQWVIVTFLNDNSLMVPRTIRYTLNHLAEGMEARYCNGG